MKKVARNFNKNKKRYVKVWKVERKEENYIILFIFKKKN